MHLQGSRGRRFYKCANKTKGVCDSGIITSSRTELVFMEVLAKIDSLSLVRTSSGSLTKQLQVVEGRIEELRAKQAEAEAAHEEFPSRITAKQLQQIESDLERLDGERNVLSQELATDSVLTKEDFFEKLDLISYAGRFAANNLVKRLAVRIDVAKWGRLNEAYAVAVNTVPTMVIVHEKDDIAVRSLDTDTLDKLVLHGDIDEEARRKLSEVGHMVKGVASQLTDQIITQLGLQPTR